MSDMYAEVTKPNINPLAGKCLHACSYCYVPDLPWSGAKLKYSGPIRLDTKTLSRKVKGGVRFLCSCNDLFAASVPDEMIMDIIDWAARQDTVTWLIQTKNPMHPLFLHLIKHKPDNFNLGTTIESNRYYEEITPNPPIERAVSGLDYVTIEPIMTFDVNDLATVLCAMKPKWVWIGADSGDNHLPEPKWPDVCRLIQQLERAGIEVRLKPNIDRLREAVE